MRATLLAATVLVSLAGPALAHGWALVLGNGIGISGGQAQDQDLPSDDNGAANYPTLRMCRADIATGEADALQGVQNALTAENAADERCMARNYARARCVPYAPLKYQPPSIDILDCPK